MSPDEEYDGVRPHDFDEHPEVRELLGSLDTPRMPPEVRARLNAVIIHESAQRQASSPGRNLRRLAVAWIGGAAAVLVLATGGGYAITQLSGSASSSDSSETSSGTSSGTTSSRAESSDESQEPFGTDEPTDADGLDRRAQSKGPNELVAGLPAIRANTFAEDALAAARSTSPTAESRVDPSQASRAGCAPLRGQRQGVRVVNVRYGSSPAVLVVDEGPPPVATLYDCTGEELRSATLPEAP